MTKQTSFEFHPSEVGQKVMISIQMGYTVQSMTTYHVNGTETVMVVFNNPEEAKQTQDSVTTVFGKDKIKEGFRTAEADCKHPSEYVRGSHPLNEYCGLCGKEFR